MSGTQTGYFMPSENHDLGSETSNMPYNSCNADHSGFRHDPFVCKCRLSGSGILICNVRAIKSGPSVALTSGYGAAHDHHLSADDGSPYHNLFLFKIVTISLIE